MTTLFSTVLAQAAINLSPGGQFSGLNNITIAGIISAIIILVLIVAALVFFFMLVLGGIKYITSGGDKGQTEAARGQITAALIGLLIGFVGWGMISLIKGFFGNDITQLN